ncbi:regulatory protein RecX [Agrococcus citreus]|uniref:Regulatory protein RecX n=1 Tax=Agrococcus citreus TaxID=84643 RepID=A0ABN1YZM9_9MICO
MSDPDRLAGVTQLSAWVARDAGHDVGPVGGSSDDDDADAAEPVDEESARSIALRALGRKAASRRELDRTLERRDVEPEVRAAVLDRLEGEGLVDDAQLARDTAERLRERKHMGERGIAAELRKRGLDPDELDDADRDDELQRAIDAAAERRRRLGSLDDETAERRLAGWLQRRGFLGGTVRIAIERTRVRGPRFR